MCSKNKSSKGLKIERIVIANVVIDESTTAENGIQVKISLEEAGFLAKTTYKFQFESA